MTRPEIPDDSVQSLLWLALAVIAMLPFTMTEWPHWSLFVLPSLVVVIVGWTQIVRPRVRHYRMRNPFDVYFRIDDSGKGPLERRARSNLSAQLQINRVARITHLEHEFIIGFDGEQDKKPRVVGTENQFVKWGSMRSVSPDTNDDHYIDDKDNYHIRGDRQLIRGNTYSSGFVVEARAPGRYPLNIRTINDTGETKPKQELVLIVEEHG